MTDAAGRIMASDFLANDEQSREYRRKLRGRIMPTPDVVSDKPASRPDKPTISPIGVGGGIMSGVVSAAVRLNGMEPFAEQPKDWDVLSVPVARLSSNFEGFILPPVGINIVDYIGQDIEFDETCMLEPSLHPKIPNAGIHNSYVIRAQAMVISGSSDYMTFFASPGMTVEDLTWAGPFEDPTQTFGHTVIKDHNMTIDGENVTLTHSGPGGGHPKIMLARPDPNAAEYGGLFDLTFISVSGAAWKLHIVRLK